MTSAKPHTLVETLRTAAPSILLLFASDGDLLALQKNNTGVLNAAAPAPHVRYATVQMDEMCRYMLLLTCRVKAFSWQ
jgi:hypothetical protein